MRDLLVVQVIDVRVGVHASARDREVLRAALGTILVEDGGPADVTIEVAGSEPEDVLGAAARAAVGRTSFLLLHAGAVAHGDGVILFPGESGTGKSTMTAACLARGMTYISDEMVAIDIDSVEARGWPRPLMLTAWSAQQFELSPGNGQAKTVVPPDVLGARTATDPMRIAHVVLLETGAQQTSLEAATPGTAITELLRASFNHFQFGTAAWETAVGIARQARTWRLKVAHLDEALDRLDALPWESAETEP